MVRKVAISMDGLNISNLLNREFMEKVKEKNPNLIPISLIMISSISEKGINVLTPISLGHTNNDDVQKKRMQINCQDEKLLMEMEDTLKKLGAK